MIAFQSKQPFTQKVTLVDRPMTNAPGIFPVPPGLITYWRFGRNENHCAICTLCSCPGWIGEAREHLMRPGWRWPAPTWRTHRHKCGTHVRAPRWTSTSNSCPKASSGQSTDWAVWWI